MLEAIYKNKDGKILVIGQSAVLIVLVLSFVLFVLFSIKIVNGAIQVKLPDANANQPFNLTEFAKIKPLVE